MKIICAIAATICFLSAHSQEGDSTRAVFKIGVNYNSHLNYYGRTDKLKSTGFFPQAELWFRNEFYLSASPVFVSSKLQSFEYSGTVATAGYQHLSEQWLTHLYINKPIYKAGSQLVQSALKGQAGLNLTRLGSIINITAGADAKLSERVDYGFTAGVDHLVRAETGNGSVLVIDPSVYVFAGTQNFSYAYQKKQHGLPLLPLPSEQEERAVRKFSVLAWEASIPVMLSKEKWMLQAIPAYILPQNLLTVPDRPELSESGEAMFYFTLGLKRSF